MFRSVIQKNLLRLLLITALLACAVGGSTAQTANTESLLYSAGSPIPANRVKAIYAAELRKALRDIKAAIPAMNMVHFFVEVGTSSPSDWVAILDVCQSEGFRAAFGFAEPKDDGSGLYRGYRPVLSNGTWQTGDLGKLVSCRECVTHPAFYAVFTIDEPHHHEKRPSYSTNDLKSMYAHLKSLAPAGTDPKLVVQYSRELWRYMVKSPNPQVYWDRGICDIVQISALEFQDREYWFDQLDQNHYWSRRIVHEKTPDIPLWTSVQTFGSKYGPSAGYWFPRERDGYRDLFRLLNDIMAEKYQVEHPLTGMMFQKWNSEEGEAQLHQYTLGDKYLGGQPQEQVSASDDAIRTINEWIQLRTPAPTPTPMPTPTPTPTPSNPIDDPHFFVRQHYLDFLNREPEPAGLDAWVAVLNRCNGGFAGSDPSCDRIIVSQSFFQSEEFQLKGYFVYRFYKASLGRLPRYGEITSDMARVTGQTGDEVVAKKEAFTNDWVGRSDFKGIYDRLSNAAFVDKLLQTAGVQLTSRNALVADLDTGRKSRAQVVREVVESPELFQKEYNSAFVAMQYFGYLRRDPESAGYEAWLRVINQNPADYRTMVWGFIESAEYRSRFSR